MQLSVGTCVVYGLFGDHPTPFSLLDSETPADSSLFFKAPTGFSVVASPYREEECQQLEKGQSFNHIAFQ